MQSKLFNLEMEKRRKMKQKNSLKPKISIIGCGNVGIRYAYAVMIKSLARSIVITDINTKKLKGEVMDLSHSTPYIPSPVEVAAGDYPDTKDSDLIVITAGAKQEPGQSRLDLVNNNVKIFKKIIPELIKYSPEAVILVVTNPVDILSYAAYKISGKNPNSVIGSGTVLDTARFRYLLGAHCSIDSRNIHAYILGEHGDTEFPVWSRVMLGGILLRDYCPVCGRHDKCEADKELHDLFLEVKNSAYKIIDYKGETSYGIGLAMARITSALLGDENSILPVSVLVNDFIGIDDVYMGLPTILNRSGVKQVLPVKLNDTEKEQFRHSAWTLKEILKKSGF